MDKNPEDKERAEFYTSHRERSATAFKDKHRKQYDAEFAGLTGATPSMSVLEIGCGTGIFLRYLEASQYSEIVGVDMDSNLSEALHDLKSCEIYLDDIDKVLRNQLDGRRFDRIVLLDVCEHLQLPVLFSLMERLGNHIKPDGRLLLRVPNIESPWGLKMFYGTFDHVTPLGPGRMVELGVKTGWICEGCYPQEPSKFLRRMKERLINSLMSALLSYHPDIWTANLLAVYRKS